MPKADSMTSIASSSSQARALISTAHDPRVEEVFELVDHDQEDQRAERGAQGVGQADDDDHRVRDQVADHRQQAGEKGE